MNFDSTIVGNPYNRIEKIIINYTAPMTAVVSFTSKEYVKLQDGTHRPLSGENVISFDIEPDNMLDKVQLRDSNTGDLLGVEMSYGQIMLGILGVIRSKQE